MKSQAMRNANDNKKMKSNEPQLSNPRNDISQQKIPTLQRDKSGFDLDSERDSLSVIQDEIRFTIGDLPSKPDSTKLHTNKQQINGLQPTHLLKMVQQDSNMVFNNQNLTEVPKQLTAAQFKQVTILDLSHNFIVEISEQLSFSLPSLQQLILNNNKLEYVNPNIKNLKYLLLLKINSNNLKNLPAEIGEIQCLQHLDVSDNQLQCLPDSIGMLEANLKYLNLAHNQLKILPPEIGQLYNLQSLFLENNHFIFFPSSLRDLINLKELALDWFKYMSPPLPQLISNNIGEAVLEMVRNLCKQQIKKERFDVTFVEFLQFFSEQQFDINQTDNRSRTLVHNASQNGDIGVLKSLIRSGADLNVLDKDDCTPLCVSIRECQFEAARVLIENGADVNKGGGVYGSALHLAIVRTNLLLTDMMIKRGAEVNVIDVDGNTPLHFIMNVFSKSESKYRAIAECLVLSGAKPNKKNLELWTPIHIAARKGQIEGIRWAKMTNEILKEMNLETFDFNMPGGAQRWTPLHLAGYSGHSKIVEEILSGTLEQLKNFPINVYARNCDFKTPRQCTKGNLVLTKIFRKAEKRYLKEVFEVDQINEIDILHSKQLPSQNIKDEQKVEDNYISLLTDYKKIKFKNECQISLKAHSYQAQRKRFEPSIRLEQSRIFDQEDFYENEEDNKSLNVKKVSLKNQNREDQPRTLLQELMENMSPRSVNLKLQFFKGVRTIATGNGIKQKDMNQYQNNINSDINLITLNKNSNINLYYLKDKVLENQILHEKYEALSLIQQNQHHQHFDQMMRLMIEKIQILIDDQRVQSIVNEITSLVISLQKLELIDLLTNKLKSVLQANSNTLNIISLDDLISDLLNAKKLAITTQKKFNSNKQVSSKVPSSNKKSLNLSKRHPQLFHSPVQPGQQLYQNMSKTNTQKQNLFSMKQAASLISPNQQHLHQQLELNIQDKNDQNKITYKINETPKISSRAHNYFGQDDLL